MNTLGSGADLPEMAGMFNGDESYSVLAREFKHRGRPGRQIPAQGFLSLPRSLTQLYANPNFGLRSLQDFKKITSSR